MRADNVLTCHTCGTIVSWNATACMHSCRKLILPILPNTGLAEEAIYQDAAGNNMRCKLCSQFIPAGYEPHNCQLTKLRRFCVDATGVTLLPDLYNHGKEDPNTNKAFTDMVSACRSYNLLCVTLVQLETEKCMSHTLTYLDPDGAIVDCQHFKRGNDGVFQYVPDPGSSKRIRTDAVRFLPGTRADNRYPRLFYYGHVVEPGDKNAEASDAGLALMDCTDDDTGRETKVNPEYYGSMAFKLNHTCGAKMDSASATVVGWNGRVGCVLQPCGMSGGQVMKDKQAPHFKAHEELTWSYLAKCEEAEEEMVCCCGQPGCKRLLTRWQNRPKGKEIVINDDKGKVVPNGKAWANWLKELCAL